MHRIKWLLATTMVCGALAGMNIVAGAQSAIISNGAAQPVLLGVANRGQLNVGTGNPSRQGNTTVGVRYLKFGAGGTEYEYTADGCLCEGWGVADAGTGLTGYANFASGIAGLTPISFASTPSTATVVVETSAVGPLTPILRVTHDYKPSTSSHLYVDDVTIENVGTVAVTDLRFRRVMDWDIEPTAFSEFVTIGGWPAANLLASTDDGFRSGNPLSPRGSIVPGTTNTNFTHVGPADHGALFDFGFGGLAPFEKKTFQTFYGGADSVTSALVELGIVGAEVYSLAEPNASVPPGAREYTVAIFGFKGVGGTPVGVPEPGALAMLIGMGVSGSGLLLRRRRAR